MKIIDYAVKNPQLTLLLFIMAIVVGFTTVINMPRSEDPEVRNTGYPIVIIYPGTSPKDIENLVVDPIEKKLSGLENIKTITSESTDGLAVITVMYNYGINPDEKYQELIREIDNLRPDLPQDIYNIEILKWLPSNVNVLQIALISESAPLDKLKKTAEDLKDALGNLPQLKNVEINGLPEKNVRIELKLDKISSMHIPLDAIIGSIQSEGINIPGGRVKAGSKTFNITSNTNYKSVDEIKSIIIYSIKGKNVFLRDVADVFLGFEESNYTTRLNTNRCLFVVAALKPGENISKAQIEYLKVIDSFKSNLSKNIDVIVSFDQAENVNRRLGGLGIDFLIAIGLVALTLLPLGSRATTIVMMTIPLSVSAGIVIIYLFGFTLNQLSIVGLVVALGLLVDDSIVVIENIERWLREGYSKIDASIKATKQIAIAVLGTTATLIIAFLPLMVLPGDSGEFIRNLPAAVIACVFASMIVSLTIIPFLSNKLLVEHNKNYEGNMFLRAFKIIIKKTYSNILDKALNKPIITLLFTFAIFIGSLLLIPVIGFSLFPSSEKPQFLVNINTQMQSNIDYTNSIALEIEKELKKFPEVKYISANIGKGNPQVYYNVMQKNETSNFAQLFVQLDDDYPPSKKIILIEYLRKKWLSYPGAKIEVKNFEQGMVMEAPIEVRLFGNNLDTLRALSFLVEKILKNSEGTIYVKNPLSNLQSDILVDINKEKAHSLGIPTINIAKTVRLAVSGFNLGKLTDNEGNNYNVILTNTKKKLASLSVFENLFVNNFEGKAIPLSQVASLKFESSPLKISHRNKSRVVSIFSSVKKGFLNDNIINKVIEQMDNFKLPKGYSYEMGGELESRKNSFKGLDIILIVTLFLFIIVLVVEFKTFKSTLIVLSVIPLGIVGAVLALLITGNSFSFVATIGLIALAGIEVKNTILLVDFTNQLRQQGLSLDDAIREAGEVRFLPIVLTSLTAIGGLIPIAVSTNPLISPLAVVIIGGLISSTLLSRIVTPVVYKLLAPKITINLNVA